MAAGLWRFSEGMATMTARVGGSVRRWRLYDCWTVEVQ